MSRHAYDYLDLEPKAATEMGWPSLSMFERTWGHNRQEVPVNKEKSARVDVSRCSCYQARHLPVNAPCADVMRRTRNHISLARLADYTSM